MKSTSLFLAGLGVASIGIQSAWAVARYCTSLMNKLGHTQRNGLILCACRPVRWNWIYGLVVLNRQGWRDTNPAPSGPQVIPCAILVAYARTSIPSKRPYSNSVISSKYPLAAYHNACLKSLPPRKPTTPPRPRTKPRPRQRPRPRPNPRRVQGYGSNG